MEHLRSASFGALFAGAFVVAATFQCTMALLGVIIAVAAPSMIKLNGAPAASPGQALVGVLIMLVVFLLMNALVFSVGTAVWLGLRRLIFRSPPSSAAA